MPWEEATKPAVDEAGPGGENTKTSEPRRTRSARSLVLKPTSFVIVVTFAVVIGFVPSTPAAPVPSTAAAQAEPPNPLATVKSLKCHFPVAAAGTWKEGQAKADVRTQELNFEVNNIDVQDATAEYVGTAGRVFVSAVLSGWSMYFVETSVGQLNVTTVFAQETTPKKLKAVHARHGYLQMSVGRFISEPSVSQSYGECEIAS